MASRQAGSASSNHATGPNKWSITQDFTLGLNHSDNHPNLTQDSTFTDEFYMKHEQMLSDVKLMLSKFEENQLEGLIMVDMIQKIGVDYHFQEEIEDVLKRQYMAFTNNDEDKHHDLYYVSLRFRLLRQQGYNVPADVFVDFKDKKGKFTEKLGQNIRGLLGLYEASQLSIEGEDILEEAQNFSCNLLNVRMRNFIDHHEARMVRNTLKRPCHKSLARPGDKNFVTDLNGTNGCKNILKDLAKMDFDIVQSVHKRELLEISRWWNDLGLSKELKFARDQPLKWHMWTMAALTNPALSNQRIELTKPISLIYIIDDIFDVYGTLDDLTLFTQAVNRWELAAIENLPDYMKICFKALYDITDEMAYNVYMEHGWNPRESLQKTWGTLCDAFLVEAKWFASGHLPKAEEYLKNGIVSSGAHVVLVHMFFLLGEGKSKKSANIVNDYPGIISCVATILRLWDDLGSAKDENQEGNDGSYIACYMNEHRGTSVELARNHVRNMISETWKQLNKECLYPNPFSATFTKASLNLARMVSLMYSYDDNQALPELEEHIQSALKDCVYV